MSFVHLLVQSLSGATHEQRGQYHRFTDIFMNLTLPTRLFSSNSSLTDR